MLAGMVTAIMQPGFPACLRRSGGLLLCCLWLAGAAAAQQQEEAWFEDDAELRALAVNEGELVFLAAAPAGRVLQTRNRLVLSERSLADGWVQLEQCQENLDPVPALEIVYRYQAMRGLHIRSYRGMARAWVQGASVQLLDVGEGAEVCIGAEVRILRPAGEGRYGIVSGPFHRRFLDGYYPLRLDYRISWPAARLRLESLQPEAQAGFGVTQRPGELQVSAVFEGRLNSRVVLREPGLPAALE